ncbi:prostaglandin E receptor 1c (subtype EP1) [Seriola aureovittata]|uniref:prostaglandin E receptor 1c (subtype EP1) n=1 Tax=Seriola aureovittata TaxID=2871759 RepID=UPI0024BEE2BB|nr:prostaglandin E receptor 1c (subtype EP1) [Seriola aureovittata]
MRTPSTLMTLFSTSSTPSILHQNMKMNSSEQPSTLLNSSTWPPISSSGLGLSCLSMTFGAVSNLTALGILVKSRVRFRRQSKTPFLLLTVALLMADFGGHMIPGAFVMYLYKQEEKQPTFCQIFGACMVFFGLCPLLFGCAMAMERCVAIAKPFYHATVITVTHAQRVVLFLASLALMLAVLPLFAVGTYSAQFPGTWCFLPIHGPQSTADTRLALAFSGLGLTALTLSLLCNILSGVVLLKARINRHNVNAKLKARCTCCPSSASTSSVFWSLEVEMMAQLAAITVVSCVCWSPFLIHILVMKLNRSPRDSTDVPDGLTLLCLRMASWNQVLDPWIYILLRRAVISRACCAFYPHRPRVTADGS